MERISKTQIKLVKSLQQKKYRDEAGLFVAEGEKCVEELRKGFELVHFYREGENATRTEIEQLSSLRTPQGVIGVFKKSEYSEKSEYPENSDLLLVLDGIQDPGNLGTIIRTCDWFGVRTVLCSPDTADCYNPKVVQATMGALARVHVHYLDLPSFLKNTTLPVYGTLLDGRDMYEALKSEGGKDLKKEGIIIMGNEGNGISQAVRPFITRPLRIPSYPKDAETSESLNVAIATAIVLAEFRRQV
ncbi:MAG: RNA methyltransferase [Paludibacteraceae bacterium]|nr:RNA methyltransferase [Paludibacteraceae bacterium]